MIYLDYAATSWPKPPEVLHAISNFLECSGGNPGRSGHRLSIAAGRIVFSARQAVAQLFNNPDPMRVIFTHNVTYALNLALRGLLKPGDRVVTSSMEHNSVMRPLRALEEDGVQVVVVGCDSDGCLDLQAMREAVIPGTRLVVVTHASNVVGALLPVEAIASIAHQVGALLLVDAAQTAGVISIDQPASGIDLLAFTGHKGLYGPTGTGGLVIGDGVDIEELQPLVRGGTGSRSEFEEQPELLPDKYESGTPNAAGIAGLGAGISWILARGIESIRSHEAELTDCLVAGLLDIPGLTVYGPCNSKKMVSVVSFRGAGLRVSDVGLQLDEDFGVLCRVGLHCAPAAHRTIGTFPEGTLRLAPGAFTSRQDIHTVIKAMEQIVRKHG
jgi:cysteine desulfurase/selenocysteine lyase